MSLGLVARKCGMTRIFQENGESVPVTVLEIDNNRIAQIKTDTTDGYRALQIAVGKIKASHVKKPMVGHFAKAGIEPAKALYEFRLNVDDKSEYQVGQEIRADMFKEGQLVDVAGISKGKGFAGVIKRHHFNSQDASHGNSLSHRVPGSTGMNQSPGRVFPGKRMPGHLGNVMRTLQKLQVVRVDSERNLLLVKGGVPGAPDAYVVILPSVKAKAGDKK